MYIYKYYEANELIKKRAKNCLDPGIKQPLDPELASTRTILHFILESKIGNMRENGLFLKISDKNAYFRIVDKHLRSGSKSLNLH